MVCYVSHTAPWCTTQQKQTKATVELLTQLDCNAYDNED